MLNSKTNQGLILPAVIFVISGVAILILNVINYFQDGRINSFSVFGFLIILFGLWIYSQGKKPKSDEDR